MITFSNDSLNFQNSNLSRKYAHHSRHWATNILIVFLLGGGEGEDPYLIGQHGWVLPNWVEWYRISMDPINLAINLQILSKFHIPVCIRHSVIRALSSHTTCNDNHENHENSVEWTGILINNYIYTSRSIRSIQFNSRVNFPLARLVSQL